MRLLRCRFCWSFSLFLFASAIVLLLQITGWLSLTDSAVHPADQRLTRVSGDQLEAVNRIETRPAFSEVITSLERAVMLELLETADQVFKHYNVTYIAYGGTLLGSHRHMGLIPWDDDIDLLVNVSFRHQMLEAFRKMAPSLTLYETPQHDKLCHGLSRPTNPFTWRWPYLDVSYFEENSTHIWDIAMTYGRWFVYPKSLTLPLHPRPFEHLWLPAPRDTLAFLHVTYGRTETCSINGYSHMTESDRRRSGRKPCRLLRHSVPFVHRWPCPNGDPCVRETLKLGARTVRSEIAVAEPPFAVNDPFSLRLRPGFTQPLHYPAMSDTDLW